MKHSDPNTPRAELFTNVKLGTQLLGITRPQGFAPSYWRCTGYALMLQQRDMQTLHRYLAIINIYEPGSAHEDFDLDQVTDFIHISSWYTDRFTSE